MKPTSLLNFLSAACPNFEGSLQIPDHLGNYLGTQMLTLEATYPVLK